MPISNPPHDTGSDCVVPSPFFLQSSSFQLPRSTVPATTTPPRSSKCNKHQPVSPVSLSELGCVTPFDTGDRRLTYRFARSRRCPSSIASTRSGTSARGKTRLTHLLPPPIIHINHRYIGTFPAAAAQARKCRSDQPATCVFANQPATLLPTIPSLSI
jgi:hypothetical protein